MLYLTKKSPRESDGRARLTGIFMLVSAAFIWGTSMVSQSGAMSSVGPFTFTAMRAAVGAVSLFIFYIFTGDGKQRKHSLRDFTPAVIKSGAVCGTVLFFSINLQQIGLVHASPGKASFITSLYIILVPVIGVFLGRRTRNAVWVSAGISIIGFYLLNVTPGEGFGLTVWELLVLLCAVGFSFHILTVESFGAKINSALLSCVQFITVSLLSFCFVFVDIKVLGYTFPGLSVLRNIWFNLLYAGLFSCGIAFTLQIAGQKYLPASSAALILSLESVFAASSAWLFSPKNALGGLQLVGCALIFAAVCLSGLPLGSSASLKKRSFDP